MAHPPRIPMQLPWGTEVTYFVTICEAMRRKAWANDRFFETFTAAVNRLESEDLWFIHSAVVMPDHFHLLASPLRSRYDSVGNLTGALKRWTRANSANHDWQWQPGSFDRLLRPDESVARKWEYMRENPVRSRLVAEWQNWPWSIGIREPVVRN